MRAGMLTEQAVYLVLLSALLGRSLQHLSRRVCCLQPYEADDVGRHSFAAKRWSCTCYLAATVISR